MTARALLIGTALVAFFAAIGPYTDLWVQGSKLAFNHLPISALVSLLLLVALGNGLLRRLAPRWALTSRELALIYIMVLVASPLPSAGFVLYVLPVISAARYFATPENDWATYFHKRLPDWIGPTDQRAIKWFYEGLPDGQALPWAAWLAPLAAWTLLALMLIGSFFCLAVLLRRQWIEHERLTFPLAQIPLEIIGKDEHPSFGGGILGSRVLWAGFILIAAFHSLASLHLYFPSLPEVKMANILIFQKLVTRPWLAWQDIAIFIYPSVIGVTFLLSQDVAASLWIFFWLSKLQKLGLYAIGFNEATGPIGGYNQGTVLRGQEIGGFLAMTALIFWGARGQLAKAARTLRGGPNDPAGDPVPGFWALAGFVACTLGITAWGVAAGMTPLAALLGIMLFCAMVLGLTRLVNAGGALWVEANWLPYDVINSSLGSATVGAGSLTILGMQQMVFMFDQRAITMPFLMDSMKIGHTLGIKGKHLALAAGVAVVTALAVGLYAGLTTMYHHGALTLDTWYAEGAAKWPFNDVMDTMKNPMEPSAFGIGCMTAGAAFMGLLAFLNKTYLWFRVSPLGYLFGSTWTMGHLWFSVLVGWLLNVSFVRAGGFRLYRRARPFFIGLVVGEFFTAAVWLLIDCLCGVRMHVIFPAE